MTRRGPGRGLHRFLAGERGITMPELIIAMAVTSIMATAFVGIMISVQDNVIGQEERTRNNDQARLAIMQLDREIRSGNILYDPSTETDPFYSLRVYTQANAPTRDPAFQCVQWKIQDRKLLRRWWPAGAPTSASGWGTVAEGVVNVQEGVPAFALDPEAAKGSRTLDVTLMVSTKFDTGEAKTVRIQTSLTGRNTTYEFNEGACTPAPD